MIFSTSSALGAIESICESRGLQVVFKQLVFKFVTLPLISLFPTDSGEETLQRIHDYGIYFIRVVYYI